jgi:hypothetical protein
MAHPGVPVKSSHSRPKKPNLAAVAVAGFPLDIDHIRPISLSANHKELLDESVAGHAWNPFELYKKLPYGSAVVKDVGGPDDDVFASRHSDKYTMLKTLASPSVIPEPMPDADP